MLSSNTSTLATLPSKRGIFFYLLVFCSGGHTVGVT